MNILFGNAVACTDGILLIQVDDALSAKKVWEETQCNAEEGGCDEWSPHLDWYNGLEAIVQKIKKGN